MTTPIGSKDPAFGAPFVDVDEWHDAPVRHRYVHGGFEGTDARFSFYFPPPERYEGRFFQPVLPMSGIEIAATIGVLYGIAGSIEFAVDSGAYLVESNLGRLNPFPGEDWSVPGYRASAAVARYGRELAAAMYGEHRPYGYIYGGSGGALKTVAGFEGAPDVWDGAVPFVMGIPQSMPSTFSSQALAMRVLWDKFPQIVDATEPGGGDIYAGLTVEERQVLAEVTRLGFPPRSWFDVARLAQGYTAVWAVLADNVQKLDPQYFEDFWTVPGYLGQDAPQSLLDARVRHTTTVTEVFFGEQARAIGLPLPMAMPRGTATELPAALRLAEPVEGNALGARIELLNGRAAGHAMYLTGTRDDIVVVGMGELHFEELAEVAVGDKVLVDNSMYLAFQTIHRHQVDPDFEPWQQFMEGGRPIYPQRRRLIGPIMTRQGSGVSQSGRIGGKMIVVQTLMDEAAYPWQALWYRKQVEAQLGAALDHQYRLWFVEHAMHTGGAEPVVGLGLPDVAPSRKTRIVPYLGVLQQALRDVAAWVELGIAPPASTAYRYIDGQVHVPTTAIERRGPQALVRATANGGERADVAVGDHIRFEAHVEVPVGAGGIVGLEWDFDGTGTFAVTEHGLDPALTTYTSVVTHAFTAPGTYFPAVRVTNQRSVDVGTPHCRILNLGRVRVVVR